MGAWRWPHWWPRHTGPVSSFPWRLVVPIKAAELAKTRLHPPSPLDRADLARAIALDTLEAVCRALPAQSVVAVCSDAFVAPAAASLGASVVPDPGKGLNAAIVSGLIAARQDETYGVGVLLGDLPALRPADLLAALTACAEHPRAVVPDHEGSGTVLLTAAPGIPLEPGFGPGSAARHARSATRLALDLPRLRRDVDDLDDLRAVIELGLGVHTAQLLGANT